MPWHDTSWPGRKPTGFRPPTSDVPAPCRHLDVVGRRPTSVEPNNHPPGLVSVPFLHLSYSLLVSLRPLMLI